MEDNASFIPRGTTLVKITRRGFLGVEQNPDSRSLLVDFRCFAFLSLF